MRSTRCCGFLIQMGDEPEHLRSLAVAKYFSERCAHASLAPMAERLETCRTPNVHPGIPFPLFR